MNDIFIRVVEGSNEENNKSKQLSHSE